MKFWRKKFSLGEIPAHVKTKRAQGVRMWKSKIAASLFHYHYQCLYNLVHHLVVEVTIYFWVLPHRYRRKFEMQREIEILNEKK